jgi:hypothetical protein
MMHLHLRHLEAAGVRQCRDEAMKLSVQPDLARHVVAVCFQAAVVVVQPDPGPPADDGVEYPAGQAPPPRVVAFTFPATDQVVAVIERFEQPRQLRRVVLQVGVHGYDAVAARRPKTRRQRCGFAEVAPQAHAAHPRVLPREGGDHLPGAVCAAVVDEKELEVEPVPLGGAHDLPMELV